MTFWQWTTVIASTVAVVSMALLIVALGCIDDLNDRNERDRRRALARIAELELTR